jgi:pimeloyl-ACP methyl ester carboxylesterase
MVLEEATTHRVELPDGEHLAVQVVGAGLDVLMLHGIPGSGSAWDGVASRLAEHYRVVVPDLLGFGESSRPRRAEQLWALGQRDALLSAIDRLGLEHAAIVGHDFGGPVGLLLAAARPALPTHLVLAATNAFPDTPIPFPLSTVTWPGIGRLAERVALSGVALSATLRLGVGRPRIRLDRETYLGDREQLRAIRSIFGASLRGLAERYVPIAESLSTIDVPTLVVWGDRDPFFPVEQGRRLAEAIPGARFAVYKGAGHFLPEERVDAFTEDLRVLLAEEVVPR